MNLNTYRLKENGVTTWAYWDYQNDVSVGQIVERVHHDFRNPKIQYALVFGHHVEYFDHHAQAYEEMKRKHKKLMDEVGKMLGWN